MICPKCGSDKVNVVMDTSQKVRDVTIFRKLGRLLLIICTCGLWLLVPRKKGSTKSRPVALCQNCGNKFNV